MSLYELAIIVFILGGIVWISFRGGAANPESTGALKGKLTLLDGDVRALSTKVGTVETRVVELDQRAASKGDIERMEGRFADWERKMDRLDQRFDALETELTQFQANAKANHGVVEAMAESLRVTNIAVKDVRGQAETILTQLASTAARNEEVCKQVDRLYDFIVERGMSK